MSTTISSLVLPTEGKSKGDQLCSLCGSTGHFTCLDHCESVLCGQCAIKHRVTVIEQMRELVKRLKICRMNSDNLPNGSNERSIQLSNLLEQNIDNSTESKLPLERINSLDVYLNIIEDYLKSDRLFNAKTLDDLEARLSDLRVPVMKHSRSPRTFHSLDTDKLLLRRSQTRSQSARVNWSKTLTVSLNIEKDFKLSVQSTFSMGQHPVIVSLIDHYLETFFCQWRDNSVILLSLLSIDVYTRGAGLTWSIPISRVLGNTKDKIIAGVWCSYIQRLILVGRYHFYMFDINRQKVRCVCECGCGARCCNGSMPPTMPRNTTLKYRCQPIYEDRTNAQRFLVCSHNGYLFYGYKSGRDTYRLESHILPFSSNDLDEEQTKQWSGYNSHRRSGEKQMTATNILSIDGQLASICVTHDRLAFVYRRFKRIGNSFDITHHFSLLDYSLQKLSDDVLLPSSIRWITAILAREKESKYLLCDPRSQQLLLYQSIDQVLIRRFHIGPVNACCLSDGRLVLWIQKSYASTPIGRLHFISGPHIENDSLVSTSFELLKD